MLDEQSNIVYIDAIEAEDGYLYIAYDRERGSFLHSFEEVYSSARKILLAKITEQDIINGKLVHSESRLKWVESKFGKYAHEDEYFFAEQ